MTSTLLGFEMSSSFSSFTQEFSAFSLEQIYKSFLTLFVTIDIIGAIPIILSLKSKGQEYHATQVGVYSGIILIAFLFAGEPLLGSFGADISTFGVAGGIVLFVMAVEMIFGIEIFKSEGSNGNSTFVPLVFPLFAGAAVFVLSLFFSAIPSNLALVTIAVTFVLALIPMFGATIAGVMISLLLAFNALPGGLIFAAFFITLNEFFV